MVKALEVAILPLIVFYLRGYFAVTIYVCLNSHNCNSSGSYAVASA